MSLGTLGIFIGGFFVVGVTGALLLYVLSIFWNQQALTGIFTANTSAANFTNFVSQAVFNIAEQLPNAGKLAGVAVLIGVVALMGIGGFAAYRGAKDRGYI